MWRDLLFKTSVADCFLFMEKPIDSEIVRRILERHQSALDDILADELPPDLDKEKGLCYFLESRLLDLGYEDLSYSILRALEAGWEHHSGDIAFPVPSLMLGKSAEQFYHSSVPKWEGHSLQLRKSLAAYINHRIARILENGVYHCRGLADQLPIVEAVHQVLHSVDWEWDTIPSRYKSIEDYVTSNIVRLPEYKEKGRKEWWAITSGWWVIAAQWGWLDHSGMAWCPVKDPEGVMDPSLAYAAHSDNIWVGEYGKAWRSLAKYTTEIINYITKIIKEYVEEYGPKNCEN